MEIDVLKMLPGRETLFQVNEVPIYFVKDTKQMLLGAEGFLDNFVLTVDYPNRVFSLVTKDEDQQ